MGYLVAGSWWIGSSTVIFFGSGDDERSREGEVSRPISLETHPMVYQTSSIEVAMKLGIGWYRVLHFWTNPCMTRAAVGFEEFTTVLSDHSRIEMGPISFLVWAAVWLNMDDAGSWDQRQSTDNRDITSTISPDLGILANQLWNQPSQKQCEPTLECTITVESLRLHYPKRLLYPAN